jgi:hypothetical protein
MTKEERAISRQTAELERLQTLNRKADMRVEALRKVDMSLPRVVDASYKAPSATEITKQAEIIYQWLIKDLK